MGGRGASYGGGGGSASKLRNMTSEQREDFMAAYNLAGKDFRATHTPNQAYDAALKRHDQFSKERGIKIDRTRDAAAVKGMEMIHEDIAEANIRRYSQWHEELRREYISLLPKNSAGKFEKQMVNLMPSTVETLERKIKVLKASKAKKKK